MPEGLGGFYDAYNTMATNRRADVTQQLELEKRRQEKIEWDMKNRLADRANTDSEDMRREYSDLSKQTRPVETTISNPARSAFDLSNAGSDIVASGLRQATAPSPKGELTDFNMRQSLSDDAQQPPAVQSMAGLIQQPSSTVKQTTQVPLTGDEKTAKMVDAYLRKGMLTEASKHTEINTKISDHLMKSADHIMDVYAKTGFNWNMTKNMLKMNAAAYNTTPDKIDELDRMIAEGGGADSGGYRTIKVPGPGGIVQEIMIDAKGKPVNQKQTETTAQSEAAKEQYRNTRFEEKLKMQGIAGERAERMLTERYRLAAALKQSPNVTDTHLDTLTEMSLNGHMPSNINGRNAAIFVGVYENAKKEGKQIDFNGLKTDVAAQQKIKSNVAQQEVNSAAAHKHLERFEMLYNGLGNEQIPVINKAVLAIQKGLGAPKGDAAAAVLYEALNEYAKVISGQTTGQAVTDTASAKAAELMSVSNSPDQVKAKMKEFKMMMKEKIDSGKEVVQSFSGASIRNVGNPNVPAGKRGDKPNLPPGFEQKAITSLKEGQPFTVKIDGKTVTGRKVKGVLQYDY